MAVHFTKYDRSNFDNCLELFNDNCPQYFADNERDDYIGFLKANPLDYFVGEAGNTIASAFGITKIQGMSRSRLSWILVSPTYKGSGIGMAMMNYAKDTALAQRSSAIDIAASHLSAPFFAKFGAKVISTTDNGWGPGMHRVDMELSLSQIKN